MTPAADISLIRHLVDFDHVQSRLSEDVVREISRTDPWRGRVASKKSGQIFETPTHSCTCPIRRIWCDGPTCTTWCLKHSSGRANRSSMTMIYSTRGLSASLTRPASRARSGKLNLSLQGVKNGGKGRQEVFVVSDRRAPQGV